MMKKEKPCFSATTDADEKERERKIADKQKRLAKIKNKMKKCKSSDLTLPVEDVKFLLTIINELNNALNKIYV
jgi:hypothetical protein